MEAFVSESNLTSKEQALRMRQIQLAARAQQLQGYMLQGKKVQSLSYAHKKVVEVAKAIAHELYDAMMSNNETYAVWQRFCEDLKKSDHEAEFVALATPHLLDDARATLAGLLGQPGKESLKEEIYDVLMKDNLIRGTGGIVPLAPAVKEANKRHGR